ncbi:MAG: prepilin peptidase [Candidatus Aminicenantes bacterium]|nr:prepilin peptidase [Candidatus Aminicenantes bacterium]
MDWIAVVPVVAGLVIGSFLNVCIHRLPRGLSVIRPRSRCPGCSKPIPAGDNIPILSFLLLKGRCRACHAPISRRYPLVEAATAVLFLGAWIRFEWSSAFVICCLFLALILTLTVIDLYHRILPDVLTVGGLAAGILLSPLQDPGFFRWETGPASLPAWDHLGFSLLGAGLGGGFLWLVAALYRRFSGVDGMGFGDVKMTAMLGAFLGWRCALLSVFVGSVIGAAAGSIYMRARSKGRSYPLPFGTFLGVASAVAAFWGPGILRWYFSD